MKLFELISTQTKTITSKSPFDIEKMERFRDKRAYEPDSGAYGYGETDKKDPHTFNKKTFVPSNLENDGYFQYVKAIEPYMADNPCFPRVYVVKLTKDSNGKVLPQYKMESLTDGSGFSLESLLSMARRIYPDFDIDNTTDNKFASLYVRRKLARFMLENIKRNDFSGIEDRNVKGALMLISRILKKNNKLILDLHSGNIMIRGTSTGPQLVITDPIAEGTASEK
jgi:hypothetical protein